jgi:hypothetical protein
MNERRAEMTSEIPATVHSRLCELASRVRFNHTSARELEGFATDLLVAGFHTQSIVDLASGVAEDRVLDAAGLFARVLTELGYPPLDDPDPWWLHPSFDLLARGQIDGQSRVALWLRLSQASPTFGLKWDPEEDGYDVAADLTDVIADLCRPPRRDSELRALFDVIEDELEIAPRLRELVLTGILEDLQSRVRRRNLNAVDFDGFLGPRTRQLWAASQ